MFERLKDKIKNKLKSQDGNWHEDEQFYFPEQSQPHQATWLQWPHKYTYGREYHKKLEPIFVNMTESLQDSQIVRIIVYNQEEQKHVESLFKSQHNIQFFIHETDDVWVRDNGPIFIRSKKTHKLYISHWGFNGWGEKANYSKCCKIPYKISKDLKFQIIDLQDQMVNEGGSLEIDGNGTMICCKSSILNKNRNKGLSKQDAEQIFQAYYGAKNFIWLDGVVGDDITDCHIDGFLKFANSKTVLTFSESDLQYWGIKDRDIDRIYGSKNIQGIPYKIVKIPLTKNDVKGKTTRHKSKNLGKGSYLNCYIGNKVVLMPAYDDPNDQLAFKLLSEVFPTKKIATIKVNDLYAQGGMIHCVTQQQPVRKL